MTTRETTADGVLQELCMTEVARRAFEGWKADARYAQEVVPFVLNHHTRVIYETSYTEIQRICSTSKHALGNADRERSEAVVSIRDWNPAFAFTHVLHYCTESQGQVPTWQQFVSFVKTDKEARSMLWLPGEQAVLAAKESGWSYEQSCEAFHWRVGNAYYSYLREMYTVCYLRSRGLDVQVHPLADALFRVDAWCGDVVMALYIRNGRYRDGENGRKVHVDQLLSASGSRLQFEPIRLEPADEFGRVRLPATSALDGVARRLETVATA